MDRACSEMLTATWEGLIQSRVIDGDLRETRQTEADGHNIIILGHDSEGVVWTLRGGLLEDSGCSYIL